MEIQTADELLRAAASGDYRIVSTGDLSGLAIAEASACGRLYIDEQTGLGFVLLPWAQSTPKDIERHRRHKSPE